MEAKLNIANILKNKPSGTKLYADAFGELSLECVKVNKVISIFVKTKRSISYSFYSNGSYTKEGEPILVPSKKMRDWNKFAWKRGDVLISNDGKSHVIFSRWYDDNYTSFCGKHYLNNENKNTLYYGVLICTTEKYSLEDKDAAKAYINTIEERLGGKLNLETLEIDKHQEFKDGDILSCDEDTYTQHTILILHKDVDITESIVSLVRHSELVEDNEPIDDFFLTRLYPAREDEKKELFDALAKKGKAWNAVKKQIVDLKPKWTPKPFDRVITRTPETPWTANFFSHIDSDGIKNCIDDRYIMCLPYNDETAKLIGTTNNWRG